jgi:glycopeptide antibiotics resistance protein
MNKKTKTLLATISLVAYLAVLLKLFVFKDFSFSIFSLHYRYPVLWMVDNNYVPLKTILPYLIGHPTWIDAIRNVLGNIIPFMPIGFLLPLVYRPISWKGVLGIAVAFSLCIEIPQLVLRAGIFDVDDILLNTLGGMLGYLVFLLLTKRMRSGFIHRETSLP